MKGVADFCAPHCSCQLECLPRVLPHYNITTRQQNHFTRRAPYISPTINNLPPLRIMDEEQDDQQVHSLFNHTFHLHRVSPFYHKGISSRNFLSNRPAHPQSVKSRSRPGPEADEEDEEEEGILDLHARCFEEILRGDAIRGVQINQNLDHPEDDPDDLDGEPEGDAAVLGRAGRLMGCRWSVFDPASRDEDPPRERRDRDERYQGVVIEVVYERMTYAAVLLGLESASASPSHSQRDQSRSNQSPLFMSGVREDENRHRHRVDENGEFTSLPLLLIRMPRPLKTLLIEYLSSRFDTRISSLRFDSGGMAGLLEGYLTAVTTSSLPANSLQELPPPRRVNVNGTHKKPPKAYGQRRVSLEEQEIRIKKLVKDVQLTLSFPQGIASPMLKSLDITIPRKDVISFWKRGKQLTSTTSSPQPLGKSAAAGPSARNNAPQRSGGEEGSGFIKTISEYLMTNLAFTQPLVPSSSAQQGGLPSTTSLNNTLHDEHDNEDDDDDGNKGDETGNSKQGIAIAKIVCGGFSVWAEGRVKINGPHSSSSPARTRRRSREEDEEVLGGDDDEGDEEEDDLEAAREGAREEVLRDLIQRAEGRYML